MTHFYLTLPSNSSSKFYPSNTLANYLTRLQAPISLVGEWEVALTELIFPRSWYTYKGGHAEIKITCCGCELPPAPDMPILPYTVEITLGAGYYGNTSDLVKAINGAINRTFSPPPIYQHVPPKRLETIAHQTPKLTYDELKNRMTIFLPPYVDVEFSSTLCSRLGISRDQNPFRNYEAVSINYKGTNVCDPQGDVHSMYVYCDILEYIPIGDTKAPLLRIVETKGANGEVQHRSFDHLRYVPIQKKQFDTIEIDIRNGFGEKMPFEGGQVTATLHFRLARSPYFL
jgi:hypothetical protein